MSSSFAATASPADDADVALLPFAACSPVLVADPARLDAAATKAFLAATARGFEFAAAEPNAAAALFCQLASEENKDLPTSLDAEMCAQSVRYLAAEGALLDASGKWGTMEASRWTAFVAWLHAAGLLTSAMQSRTPDGVNTVSLDDLRAGKAGEVCVLCACARGRCVCSRVLLARSCWRRCRRSRCLPTPTWREAGQGPTARIWSTPGCCTQPLPSTHSNVAGGGRAAESKPAPPGPS